MTTKTGDIKLPPLPVAVPWHKGYDRESLESYARAAVEANRREYLDTLKLARAIVNGHRRDNPPEDSVEADRQSQPAISDMQLHCILQVYDDALDKAREGREFDNPGRPGSLEARAWDAGTRRGKELGPISQPAASVEPNAEARRALEIASDLRKDFRDDTHNYDTMLGAATLLESFAATAAPVAQGPVAYLACNPETGEPEWGEDCVCKDNVYNLEDTGTIGRPVFFAPVAAQSKVTDEMVTRFLGWHLPQDFAPDAGISFNPSPDPHSWPVGTNLLTDPQARAMLEYVLQGAPAAQALPCNHVLEARPIDGSTSANVSCEPVCRKCGYRPAAHAAKGATL